MPTSIARKTIDPIKASSQSAGREAAAYRRTDRQTASGIDHERQSIP